jgi:general secretion pathway protein J
MHPRGGFTLIEVLLAVAILAIILVMVYGSFDQTARLAAHVDATAEQYRTARLALSRMSDELMSTYYFDDDASLAFAGIDGVSPDGLDADGITFTSRSRALPEGIPASTHNALAYELVEDRLMHTETLNPLGSGLSNEQAFPLAEGVSGFRLRYRDPKDNTWRDGWSEADGVSGLPSAVEITLYFPARGQTDDPDRDGFLALSTVVPVPMGGG